MPQLDPNRFSQIVDAARERRGDGTADTTIVSGHLSQMRLFMLRQGIEFYPRTDTYGFRRTFVEKVIEENEIDQRLEGIVDDFITQGVGLWFFRPVDENYRIMWFSKENYRAYYDANEQLEELDLIYSFRARSQLGAIAMPGPGGATQKYVRLRVKRDEIIETITPEKPQFDTPLPADAMSMSRDSRTTRNSLGFIPAIEAFNWMRPTGMDATGDFAGSEGHILYHDSLVRNIRENIRFYGNPTLVSSRPKHDLVEAGDGGGMQRPTISSRAGFSSADRPSTRFSLTGSPSFDGGVRVPRLIANLEATDRVQYITPNAVSGDQNLYARQYREEIRTALGGVDEIGISSGATAYEVKSLFGRAATTAFRKCRGLLTYGLCKLLALMIYNEEQIFRDSFATTLKIKEPVAPIKEEIGDEKAYQAALDKHEADHGVYRQKVQAAIDKAIEAQEFPPGVMGLIPDGDRRIEWRWRGPVFEESTDDILNNSIVVRNLQELGVNSIEALRYLFPSKTDEERSAMLNGYPFRLAQATQSSIATFLNLIRTMRETPHPQAPNLPLLADARLDLTPFLYRTFDFLKRELTYAGQFGDAAGSGEPAKLDPIQRARVDAGLAVDASGSDGPDFVPDAAQLPAAGGSGSGGGSMAGGVRQPVRPFERDAPIPGPGTLLARDPVGTRLPGALPFGGAELPTGIRFGDADLAAPSNAGVFAELSERVAKRPERTQRTSRRAGRRVPQRGK
jgi:hypothetical protein